MDNKNEFKPYVPSEKITPELTVTSIIMGVLLAVIFGAANAYLGLRVYDGIGIYSCGGYCHGCYTYIASS